MDNRVAKNRAATVADIVGRHGTVVCTENTSLAKVAAALLAQDRTSAIIANEGGFMTGAITENDILHAYTSGAAQHGMVSCRRHDKPLTRTDDRRARLVCTSLGHLRQGPNEVFSGSACVSMPHSCYIASHVGALAPSHFGVVSVFLITSLVGLLDSCCFFLLRGYT